MGSRLAVDDLPFSRLAVDDLPGSRLVNAEVIFAIDFEICYFGRLKVKSSTIAKKTPKKLDDLHFSRQRLVLHLTGLFQKFDFLDDLNFSRLVKIKIIIFF